MTRTEGRPPPLIGHRGAAGHAPENTLAGLRRAAALGVAWVEVDIRLTADGRLVLLHDPRLDRTTDGRGPVIRRRAADLAGLDAGSWFAPDYAGEPLPTLEQAIAELDRLGLGVNLEIKATRTLAGRTADALVGVLARGWPRRLPPPLISSYQPRALAALAAAAPVWPRAIVVSRLTRGWRSRAAALGCTAIHVAEAAIGPRVAAAVKGARLALGAFTVNDPDRAAALFALGVDTVFTDYPDRIAAPSGR